MKWVENSQLHSSWPVLGIALMTDVDTLFAAVPNCAGLGFRGGHDQAWV